MCLSVNTQGEERTHVLEAGSLLILFMLPACQGGFGGGNASTKPVCREHGVLDQP